MKTRLLSILFTALYVINRAEAAENNIFDNAVSTPTSNPYSWTKLPWTTNDKLFTTTRKGVESLFKKNHNTLLTVQKFKIQAKADVNSSVKRFKWAYATWYYYSTRSSENGSATEIINMVNYLRQAPCPPSYEYARVRFLLEVEHFARPEWEFLGRRLLQRDSNDFPILWQSVRVLGNSRSLSVRVQAVPLAKRIVALRPRERASYAKLGNAYYDVWWITRDKKNGSKSIEAYGKYLQMAPANEPFRASAQRITNYIRNNTEN